MRIVYAQIHGGRYTPLTSSHDGPGGRAAGVEFVARDSG